MHLDECKDKKETKPDPFKGSGFVTLDLEGDLMGKQRLDFQPVTEIKDLVPRKFAFSATTKAEAFQ